MHAEPDSSPRSATEVPPRPLPKFTLRDAMILTAATALCFALAARQAGYFVDHLLRVARHYDRLIAEAPPGNDRKLYEDQMRSERAHEPATNAIPEPSTLLSVLADVASVAACTRRRRLA